jgi:predicted DNA-binding protein
MYTISIIFMGYTMSRQKTVYLSDAAHRRLKILAARRNRPMGELLEELVEREAEELENPWLSESGLEVQGKALDELWSDPALDVYDDD